MGFFSESHLDINEQSKLWQENQDGILLDVRTPAEFGAGHIPGSINLPLDELEAVTELYPEKGIKLLVYCLSGGKSGNAVIHLKKMCYEHATNIGGISDYTGTLEV